MRTGRVVIIGLCMVIVLLGTWQLFTIRHVSCTFPSGAACPDDLQQHLVSSFSGQYLFFNTVTDQLAQDPFASDPYQPVAIRRYLPNHLAFTFKPEPALYRFELPEADDSTQQLLVTNNGTVLRSSEVSTLPVVQWNGEALMTDDEKSIITAVHSPLQRIVSTLVSRQIEFERIIWNSPDEIIIALPNGRRALLDSTDPETSVLELEAIQDAPELDELEAPIREIDLRFRLPVLRT